ncbi:MAG TPA: glutathione S-transferase family protein [Alphaproteobacteria bacterium]|nr:glutathione S-transferase family protein [Alphaproteobacteria bacterium]
MREFTLYIGNKATSSWSLRGWLACKLAGIDFDEVTIPLDMPETRESILRVSPSGRVPCLHHGKRRVWESIAIGECLAELHPERNLWPAERSARAHARSIAAEMHSGFAALRGAMWMNVRKRFPGSGRTPEALADIARIVAIWRDTRTAYGAGGPYLFGQSFSFADAMYAPVATRFVTWAPELPHDAASYVEAVWSHPWLKEWVAGAAAEPWPTPKYDTPQAIQAAS